MLNYIYLSEEDIDVFIIDQLSRNPNIILFFQDERVTSKTNNEDSTSLPNKPENQSGKTESEISSSKYFPNIPT